MLALLNRNIGISDRCGKGGQGNGLANLLGRADGVAGVAAQLAADMGGEACCCNAGKAERKRDGSERREWPSRIANRAVPASTAIRKADFSGIPALAAIPLDRAEGREDQCQTIIMRLRLPTASRQAPAAVAARHGRWRRWPRRAGRSPGSTRRFRKSRSGCPS